MKNVLLVTTEAAEPAEKPEVFSTLTALCRAKNWSHNYLKSKGMPFKYRGLIVDRLEVKR